VDFLSARRPRAPLLLLLVAASSLCRLVAAPAAAASPRCLAVASSPLLLVLHQPLVDEPTMAEPPTITTSTPSEAPSAATPDVNYDSDEYVHAPPALVLSRTVCSCCCGPPHAVRPVMTPSSPTTPCVLNMPLTCCLRAETSKVRTRSPTTTTTTTTTTTRQPIAHSRWRSVSSQAIDRRAACLRRERRRPSQSQHR